MTAPSHVLAGVSLAGAATLTGCVPAEPPSIVPEALGEWVSVGADQGFDALSGAGYPVGATTDEMLSMFRPGAAERTEQRYAGVDFTGGRAPDVSSITFFAPSEESGEKVPARYATVIVVEIPEIVRGAEQVDQNRQLDFGLAEVAPVHLLPEGSLEAVLPGAYVVAEEYPRGEDGAGHTGEFVTYYAAYLEELLESTGEGP